MKNKIYNGLMILFGIAFIASSLAIGYKLVNRTKAEDQADELRTVFAGDVKRNETAKTGADGNDGNTPVKLTLEEQTELRKERLSGYEILEKRNIDMKGWISIPDTEIDYPVMQSVDRPDFYLKHNFDGQKSSYGTPYIAESCDLEGKEDNIIIYGHHMKDGSMFGGLMKYVDESFYKSHPMVWFDTLTEVGLYEIIAVTKASASASDEAMFALAADKTKRQEFLDEVGKRSFYSMDQIKDNDAPLLILITCEYSQDEGRLLIVARNVQ